MSNDYNQTTSFSNDLSGQNQQEFLQEKLEKLNDENEILRAKIDMLQRIYSQQTFENT